MPPSLNPNLFLFPSNVKQLLELSERILRLCNTVTNSTRVLENLVVVSTLVCLVAKEVNGGVLDCAGEVLLVLDVLETVCLVPAPGEDVEGDLTAD